MFEYEKTRESKDKQLWLHYVVLNQGKHALNKEKKNDTLSVSLYMFP